MQWFTADTHFGHRLVARLRGFGEDREAHDESLIYEWNSTVFPGDEVFVGGDFSLAHRRRTEEIFDRLHGRKHLVRGNHDFKETIRLPWESIEDIKRLKWTDPDGTKQRLYICHYPLLTWPHAHYGSWHVHGHCHGNLKAPPTRRMDIGPDATGRLLVSLDMIRDFMEARTYHVVDHHD